MYRFPRRSLSQRNYQALQALRAENERLRQIDAGLTYRRDAVERRAGEERPLHVGPQIELRPIGQTWSAA